jgi:hypothetical protein
MRNLCLLLALALGLTLSSNAQNKNDKAESAKLTDTRIAELIKQLASESFAERKRAGDELETAGMAALPALRNAVQKTGDLETKRRCEELVRKLEQKAANAAMLTPKIVRLKFKDVPVLEAVAELARQSGYNVSVIGDRTGLADRKVTLDTGATTFWEAFDQLCAKAGLVESVAAAPQPQQLQLDPAIQIQQLIPKLKQQLPQPKPVPNVLPVPAPPVPARPPALGFQAQAQARPGQPGQPGQPGIQVQKIGKVQVQKAKAQPMQIQPAFGGFSGMPAQAADDRIQLVDGKPKPTPTAYAGAVRIRVAGTEVKDGELIVTLDVACEPRLQDFSLVASPRIDKAVDDQNQALLMAMEQVRPNDNAAAVSAIITRYNMYPQAGSSRRIPVRLKLGDKQAKGLKELAGSLSAQALTQTEALVTVDNVLKAAGQTVKGKNGGTVQVHSIDKKGDDYVVKVTLENIPDAANMNPFGGGNVVIRGNAVMIQRIQINGGGNVVIGGMAMAPGGNNNVPKLLDDKGQPYQFAGVTESNFQFNGGQATQTMTLLYRPQAKQGEPSRLVQYGQRRVDFQVPFALKNVPLP